MTEEPNDKEKKMHRTRELIKRGEAQKLLPELTQPLSRLS